MEIKNKNFRLSNGLTFPIIGLGTSDVSEVSEVVYHSIKDGVRLIDTASIYRNEKEVGEGIQKALSENLIKREDLFIITKCWMNETENPEEALKNSLLKLKLSYVDLYLVHYPPVKKYSKGCEDIHKMTPHHIFWPKMENLLEKGLTKNIGVSNFNVQSLLNIISFCKIKPQFNEIEFHPYLYQKDLKDFCELEDIKVLSYNPLCRGKYCKERHEKIMEEKNFDLLTEKIVNDLAKKYQKTPGQVVLNWQINMGVIPIPSTSNVNRMKENLEAIKFDMSEEDITSLCKFEKQFRFCDSVELVGINVFA